MKTIVTRTPEQVYDHWIAALRSGKYIQTQGALKNDVGLFCCLGVACELARLDGGAAWTHTHKFMHESALMPHEMRRFLGINDFEHGALIDLNDYKGASFKTIATYIEKMKPAALKRLAGDCT